MKTMRKLSRCGKVLLGALALAILTGTTFAQATPGGTVITNQASASYTDDPLSPTKYSATSNQVTTTVSMTS